MSDILTKQDLVEAFVVERAYMDERFTQQQTWLEAKFEGERAYYAQLLRQELSGITTRLDRLETKINQVFATEDEDIRAVSRRLKTLKAQVNALERHVEALQAATA